MFRSPAAWGLPAVSGPRIGARLVRHSHGIVGLSISSRSWSDERLAASAVVLQPRPPSANDELRLAADRCLTAASVRFGPVQKKNERAVCGRIPLWPGDYTSEYGAGAKDCKRELTLDKACASCAWKAIYHRPTVLVLS